MILWLIIAFLVPIPSYASTVTWRCNTESDLKHYEVEYTEDAGTTFAKVATVHHPTPCPGSLTHTDTRTHMAGKQMYRVAVISNSGQKSPYSIAMPVPPPPPTVSKLEWFFVNQIGMDTATIQLKSGTYGDKFATPEARLALKPLGWGSAAAVNCVVTGKENEYSCPIVALKPDTLYQIQGLAKTLVNNRWVYGPFSEVVTFKTLPAPVIQPPPIEVPPVTPAYSLQKALTEGFTTCKTKRQSLQTCLSTVLDAMKKVTR